MKHLLLFFILIIVFFLGASLGWERHKLEYEEEFNSLKLLYSDKNRAIDQFDGHIFSGLVEAVENKDFDLFYKVSCEKIQYEIYTLNYFVDDLSGYRAHEYAKQANGVLDNLVKSGYCEKEI
jgi:hypothetical protein